MKETELGVNRKLYLLKVRELSTDGREERRRSPSGGDEGERRSLKTRNGRKMGKKKRKRAGTRKKRD